MVDFELDFPHCSVQWGRTDNSKLSYPLAPVNVLAVAATKLTDRGGGVPNITTISEYEVECILDGGTATYPLLGGCIIIISM